MNYSDNDTNCMADVLLNPRPLWYHSAIYFPLFGTGFWINILLFTLYHKHTSKILGKRSTYQLIMKMIAFTDTMTALSQLVYLIFLWFYISDMLPSTSEIISLVRGTIYVAELHLFDILAIDRLIAIAKPLVLWWNKKMVLVLFFSYILTIQLCIEISARLMIIKNYQCVQSTFPRLFIKFYYATTLTLFGGFNISVYVIISIIFMTKSKNRGFDNQRMKNIIKLTLISFETTIVYVLLLIPLLMTTYQPGIYINRAISSISYLNCLSNFIIFSLNNKFFRNKIFHRKIRINAIRLWGLNRQ